MRILFINNYHYLRGGAERVFFSEIKLLERHGHEICCFSRRHPRDLPSRFSEFFPDHIHTESVEFSLSGLRTFREILYSKEAKQRLDKLLQRFCPDVAHAHNIYGRLSTSVLAALSAKDIPTVMTLHDYRLVCPACLLYNGRVCEDCRGKRFYRAILNKCVKDSLVASATYALESYLNRWFKRYEGNIEFLISPSAFLKDKFVEYGWKERKIRYIPNYIESSEIEPSFVRGEFFLYLGRLSREKGINTLIDAFSFLSPTGSKLTIAGEGPERKKLEKRAGELANVEFRGYLSGKALADIIRSSLAVVIPSECYENAPLSVLEAMAYGKPVIASRIGGIPEMIDDGVTGYLFEAGNVQELAKKLNLVLKLPSSRVEEMGRRAREKVESQYNEKRHYEMLMNVYQHALS